MANRILEDRYEILEKVGEGGMAVVYRAKDILLNREVAVKILRPEFVDDETFIKSFRRESQAAAGLSHQNIVSVFDVGESGNIYYIVMEYIRGETLNEIIERDAPLSAKTVINIGKQLCNALTIAHKAGIIHRDIKPHNIMITNDGNVKITDFGIAKAVNNATIVTSPGVIVGSVHYFSPEQAKGTNVDAKSDIYSLGIVMYEMLTGQVPFTADNPVTIAVKHMNDKPPRPSELVSGVPVDLEQIILGCLEKYPINRFPSVRVIGELLGEVNLEHIVGEGLPAKEQGEGKNIFVPNNKDFDDTKRNDGDEFYNENNSDYGQDQNNDYNNNDSFDGRENSHNIRKNKNDMKKHSKKKKTFKRTLMILGTVAGAIVLGVLIVFLWLKFMNVPDVKVPNVVGLQQNDAVEKLEAKKFKVEIGDLVESDIYDKGMVASQTPDGDEIVKEGSTVTLDIVGKRGGVPDISGMTESQAIEALNERGYIIGTVEAELSDSVEQGKIISQDPAPGSNLAKGGSVNVVISAGEEITVPDLLGMSEQQARDAIETKGLKVGTVKSAYSSKYEEGKVMKQSPSSGKSAKKGDIIDITISKGKMPAKTISYTVSFANAPTGESTLKVTLTNDGSTAPVGTWTISKTDGGKRITFSGTGKGTLKIYFNGNLTETHAVDFAKGTVS